jgi:hypothetical protein
VASWGEFAVAAPDLAEYGVKLLERPIAYLATVRPDGGPRVHPFTPLIAEGRLLAAIPLHTPKGRDLLRDPRYMVHALPAESDGEFSLRGTARQAEDRRAIAIRAAEATGAGGLVESAQQDAIFEFDIDWVDTAVWHKVGQPGTYAERRRWEA